MTLLESVQTLSCYWTVNRKSPAGPLDQQGLRSLARLQSITAKLEVQKLCVSASIWNWSWRRNFSVRTCVAAAFRSFYCRCCIGT